MIEGSIDEFGRLLIDVVVLGNRAQATVPAVLDTGFNGDLLLPVEVAIDLGLELCSAGEFELADGSTRMEMLFADLRYHLESCHCAILTPIASS